MTQTRLIFGFLALLCVSHLGVLATESPGADLLKPPGAEDKDNNFIVDIKVYFEDIYDEEKFSRRPPKQKIELVNITVQCTGTVVSAKHVLTAGHCVMRKMMQPKMGMMVFFPAASIDLEVRGPNGTQTYTTTNFTLHREFGFNFTADVAIITLLGHDKFDVLPVPLADKFEHRTNTQVTVYGYGESIDNDTLIPSYNQLQNYTLGISDDEVCKNRLSEDYRYTGDVYCLSSDIGASITPGDDGGPAMYKYHSYDPYPYQVGIASSANSYLHQDNPGSYPDYFVDISYYCNWFDYVTKGVVLCSYDPLPSPPPTNVESSDDGKKNSSRMESMDYSNAVVIALLVSLVFGM